jgi:hypothetical protein
MGFSMIQSFMEFLESNHPLDQQNWHRIPDLGAMSSKSSQENGVEFACLINDWMYHSGLKLPSGNMIGLGAGQSILELAFTRQLGIPAQQVVLSDKNFSKESQHRLNKQGIHLVTVGAFSFLDYVASSSNKAAVITFFGMEFLLQQNGAMSELIQLMTHALLPGGVACIFPYKSQNFGIVDDWRESGFETIHAKYDGVRSIWSLVHRKL